MSPVFLWLIGGAALLALEAFGMPGIGLLFAGLAALLVALMMAAGLLGMEDFLAQWAVFFVATSLLALALWRKLKNWRLNPQAPEYSNIIGTEAVVVAPIIGDGEGTVRWSGTLMRARAADSSLTPFLAGSAVRITATEGNLLIIGPK